MCGVSAASPRARAAPPALAHHRAARARAARLARHTRRARLALAHASPPPHAPR